jgi:outer membrane lipoprotein-sorting protein
VNKRTWTLAMLVVFALLVAGCQQRPTADEIVARVREVEANTVDAHAILEIQLEDPNQKIEMTVEVWESSNRFRAELLETSSDEASPGSLIVNDGQQVWIYDPGRQEAWVGPAGADQPASPLNNPREMVQYVDEAIQWVLARSEVTLAGQESIAGVPTWKLDFQLKDDPELGLPFAAASQGTLWVDQERWIVLQARLVVEGVAESAMRVRSFELNPGLSDALFTFEAPPGTTVQEIESKQPQYMTLQEAQRENPRLLVPGDVPGGATLIDVFKVQGAFVLHYDHSDTTFTVVQGPTRAGQQPDGERSEVTVRGQPATLVADSERGTRFLTWTEDGVTYIIAGYIGQEEILRTAESLQ